MVQLARCAPLSSARSSKKTLDLLIALDSSGWANSGHTEMRRVATSVLTTAMSVGSVA